MRLVCPNLLAKLCSQFLLKFMPCAIAVYFSGRIKIYEIIEDTMAIDFKVVDKGAVNFRKAYMSVLLPDTFPAFLLSSSQNFT